jgi:hypothetical protein
VATNRSTYRCVVCGVEEVICAPGLISHIGYRCSNCLAKEYIGEEILLTPKEAFDPVNKPKHYNVDPSGVECITITRHRNFNIGNAIKYLWRAGLKDAEVQDLEKAIWYINDEIKRLRGKS